MGLRNPRIALIVVNIVIAIPWLAGSITDKQAVMMVIVSNAVAAILNYFAFRQSDESNEWLVEHMEMNDVNNPDTEFITLKARIKKDHSLSGRD
jgi:dolichyl-phosphate-mannose--protein O-mannosyl transferase